MTEVGDVAPKWERPGNAVAPGAAVTMVRLLYHYDGPRMFSATYGDRLVAMTCIEMDSDDGRDDMFLVAPTAEAHVAAVADGTVSCRSLFEAPSHVLALGHDLVVTEGWTCSRADMGDDELPEVGYGLRGGKGLPDLFTSDPAQDVASPLRAP